MLKTLFYVDKAHLQKYGRPVTGDIYVKMSYGPVPSLAYDMLKENENLPADVLDAVRNALEIERCGKNQQVSAKRSADLGYFSGTDLECLRGALASCSSMGWDLVT